MAIVLPITQGKLQTSLANMAVGDYIAAKYTTTANTVAGGFTDIGTVDTTAVAALDLFNATPVLTGYLYLIKVAKGVLVPDCELITATAAATLYAALNTSNYIYGQKLTIGSTDFLVHVPQISVLTKAAGTLDGMIATTDVSTNFLGGLANTTAELVQENYNLSAGAFTWSTAAAAASTANIYARLILEYVDNTKSIDLYH